MDLGQRVRAVLALMRRLDLAELDVAVGSDRVSVRREAPAPDGPSPAGTGRAAPSDVELEGYAVCSPVAGTYFGTPRLGADPYVREGGYVSEGDVIGLVEAMKVYNEVTADRSGRVVCVLVRSGQTVSAGQPLVLLDVDDQPVPDTV